MPRPQPGIFALGTAAHAYLELDGREGAEPAALLAAAAALTEPKTTIGGVNLIVGARPSLWRAAGAGQMPPELSDFDAPVEGPDGFAMPATQHDLWLWLAGAAYDVCFDAARAALGALDELAQVAGDVAGWPYRHDRDLTGFVDGSENPPLDEAHDAAVVADGAPGAGGSVLLVQQWEHDAAAWERLGVAGQERAMGRTKDASVELEDRPEDSHVARTDQEDFGDVFRRNTPYGTVTRHGTMFVGFCAEQGPLERMLRAMAGADGGPRDALTRSTRPLTGAYYWVPPVEALAALAGGG